MWTVGLVGAIETVVNAPIYTKLETPAEVFEVPSFSVVVASSVGDITP